MKKILILSCALLGLMPAMGRAQDDAELVARVIYSEARGEDYLGQMMIAQCIFDRAEIGYDGDSVRDVVEHPNAFAGPGKLTDEHLDIAQRVENGAKALPGYRVLHFRKTESTSDWYAPYITHVGKHAVYGYELEDEDGLGNNTSVD